MVAIWQLSIVNIIDSESSFDISTFYYLTSPALSENIAISYSTLLKLIKETTGDDCVYGDDVDFQDYSIDDELIEGILLVGVENSFFHVL